MYQEICSGQFILNFKKGCIKTRFTKQACKTLLLHKKFILPSLIILYFSLLLELTHWISLLNELMILKLKGLKQNKLISIWKIYYISQNLDTFTLVTIILQNEVVSQECLIIKLCEALLTDNQSINTNKFYLQKKLSQGDIYYKVKTL